MKCAKLHIADRYPPSSRPLWQNERYSHDRIRIAYLSADFRDHAVACLIAGLFERHDRSRFEVFGFSFGPDDMSEMRSRLAKSFDQFHDVRFKSDREVAGLLRDLEVEIAVDLTGHTQFGRTAILAHRPAPMQVNYLGYPGTTGADYIDYILADEYILPFDQQSCCSERIVQLPDTYQANDSKRKISPRGFTRGETGLPEKGIVFCCFNNSFKINSAVFNIWMRLLGAIDGSVLWLLSTHDRVKENLRREAKATGIDPSRLIFAEHLNLEGHLARHRLADLFLDTLPYNAHTTASDALWAGLPLVTCSGETFAARVAGSLLNAVGLPELVTTSLEEYEALALKLARDPALLASLKEKLARNRNTYPLFNTARFTRHLEAAYITMWERYQRGEPPASFAVDPID